MNVDIGSMTRREIILNSTKEDKEERTHETGGTSEYWWGLEGREIVEGY